MTVWRAQKNGMLRHQKFHLSVYSVPFPRNVFTTKVHLPAMCAYLASIDDKKNKQTNRPAFREVHIVTTSKPSYDLTVLLELLPSYS